VAIVMRSIKNEQINDNIIQYKSNVNNKLRKERGDLPRVRRKRTRSPDEHVH